MSRAAYATPEPVEATPRRPMTPARKRRSHDLAKGLCAFCNLPVEVGEAEFDHRIPVWMGGADDDGPNLRPLHPRCHTIKTKADAGARAKVKRMKAKHEGTAPPPLQKLKGRGFPKRWGEA